MKLKINYEYISSEVKSIQQKIATSNVTEDYTSLASGFTESKGKQAEALRDLLKAEKKLSKQIDKTFERFAKKIDFVANEFKRLDQSMARKIK